MNAISSLRVSTRMRLLVGLALIGLISLCLTALFQLKSTMIEDGEQKTRNLVEVGIGVLAHYDKLVNDGKLSEEDAKKAARDSLRDLRYGHGDYFFGVDTTGVYFLNGANPAIEGPQKIDMQDANGKFLFKEMIAAAHAVELSGQGAARVQLAKQAIQKISATVSDASARIHALEERAKQVSSIANVIKDIAGQTNLLALNAAIEAARAGEQGRGFAVVADEVRKLAERTSHATTEIEQMIVGIQGDTSGAVSAMNEARPEVQEGVELAVAATESLHAIEEGAHRTLERISVVADATREQSSASTSIAQRVEQIANMVEETTTAVTGTAASARQLEQIANNLKKQIGRFRV